ncbi:M56 family metallopeptidase [Kitasatospora sp. MAP5-34]|uniref:M56 family metallopeptidase n=1 Tax=Kitasatospora sp. MAP5-34 TaxID=3035102 RepID=UPI002477005F|nr:M56 family metallopeptidase [Kitasatospora sp. MAP5-34]MDH6576631.1 beta-lactamase regulating signal transducer with metallopeptidase domain [Kitasatospora sp. MAP5-34]
MTFTVWAPLLLPFLTAPLARRFAEALAPRTAAWMLAGTAAALGGATAVSLTLLTLTGLLRLPPVAALGHLSPRWLPDGSPYTAAAAALVLLTVTALALRTVHRQYADLRRARAAAAQAAATGQLTVLEDERADAFALPGLPWQPGRIVVTTGMLRALDGPERAALLAHERAHLTAQHHVFLALTEYAAVLHPALRGLRTPLGYHLERWADETAARATGDRALTARAVGRAALAAARAPRPHRPGLAPAAHTGPVPRRVAALLAPEPRPYRHAPARTAAAVALAACLALTGSTALSATTDLHHTVEAAQGETHH